MDNCTTPLAAANLLSSTNSQSHTSASEQSSTGSRVNAQVEVEVGAVLIGARQSVLCTQGVGVCRAEVCDLDDDGAAEGLLVAAGVGGGGQLPAGSASWTGACAVTNAEFVLGDCC